MNNRCVKRNKDRFSELPEALILQILSLLPTKVAITTSVLSKQWKSVWKMMPKLEFDSCYDTCDLDIFSDCVSKSLLSHKAPVLESLQLTFDISRDEQCMDVGILIGIAYARNVRKLVIDIRSEIEWMEFPRHLYNCEILETLTIRSNVMLEIPYQVCLKSLKTLHFHYISYDGEMASFVALLSGCPNLETLLVHPKNYVCDVAETLTIAVPSLQRLSIHNPDSQRQNLSYVIDAPSLKYLEIEGYYGLGFGRIVNVMTKLVDAKIINVFHISDKNLLKSLTSVKRLSLNLPILKKKFPTVGSIFYNLVYLELYTTNKAWWDLLTCMLHCSPKLQSLNLVNYEEQGWRKDLIDWKKRKQPKNVPDCLLFHLKTFMWKGYNEWLLEEEKEWVKYILRNANHLKRATFPLNFTSKDFDNVIMASNSCQLLFK